MNFGRTFTNKLVSYADRYFTWDRRYIKREDSSLYFDFFAIRDEDEHKIVVCFRRGYFGIWASISKDDTDICRGYLKSYKEVTAFKKMIRCLG